MDGFFVNLSVGNGKMFFRQKQNAEIKKNKLQKTGGS
jgi:hypothetical protein